MPVTRYEVNAKTKARRRGVMLDPTGLIRVSTPQPPDKGKANDDIVDILAEHFGVPKSCVHIKSGHASTRKIIEITA